LPILISISGLFHEKFKLPKGKNLTQDARKRKERKEQQQL
jgi:hypothetical protein